MCQHTFSLKLMWMYEILPSGRVSRGSFFIDLKSEAENYAKFMTIFWLMDEHGDMREQC